MAIRNTSRFALIYVKWMDGNVSINKNNNTASILWLMLYNYILQDRRYIRLISTGFKKNKMI